jgi:hypothetical protein
VAPWCRVVLYGHAEHTVYMLVDADRGYLVSNALRELGLMTWNTHTVHLVVTLQESMAIGTRQ